MRPATTLPRPFPLEPLEDLLRAESLADVADQLRTTVRNVQRLRQDGLTHRLADRYACAAGWHPGLVWPEWLER